VAAIVAIGLAACGGDDDNGAEDGATGQNSDLTFSVITHGEGDTFWAVAKAGAEQAGEDLGVTVNYQESQNDPQRQAQLVESAVTEEVDGIATSVPDPDALSGAIKSATDGSPRHPSDSPERRSGRARDRPADECAGRHPDAGPLQPRDRRDDRPASR
jgi:ABC-type sugar transport system substrate-binding protein